MRHTKKNNTRGYVGLLVLLLAVGIVIVLFVRVYFSKVNGGVGKEAQELLPKNFDGTAPQTRYEQMNAAKRAAQGVQGLVDTEGKNIQEELNKK